MSYQNIIQDGTGKGNFAQVDANNRLRVFSTSVSEYDGQTANGKGFNVNTLEIATVASSSETPVFYLKNDSEENQVIEAWFFGIGGPQTGAPAANTPAVIAVYPSPALVTGGVAVPIVNRSMKDPFTFGLTALRHDAGTPLLVDGTSTPTSGSAGTQLGVPVLWQYQSTGVGARAFGVVHLHLPAGQWVVVTAKLGGTLTGPLYTGFTGYVEDS